MNGPSPSSTELTAPPADAAIMLPAKNIGKYIDYDFSKMTDTKGGFLSAQDDPDNRALHAGSKEVDPAAGKPAGMSMKDWERHQLLQKLRATRSGPFEPGLSVMDEPGAKQTCRECGAFDVDYSWLDVFKCAVCKKCKEEFPEKYSLLTKTEAREDYLLMNDELQDEKVLRHLKRPNPHKSTWNDMQLYLRYQVEEYAFSDEKWGSQEALDEEFERRLKDKKARKEKKFKEKLLDLKKKTRTDLLRRGVNGSEAQFGVQIGTAQHRHEWGRPVMDDETGVEVKKCIECGMECEEVEL